MSDRVAIQTSNAPKPIGAYSQAIKVGDMLFLAGQVAVDPATGKLIAGDSAAQTDQIMKNIAAVLAYCGLNLGNVVRCVVYVVDLAEYRAIDAIYAKHFVFEPPARSTVQVAALPGGARVEIEATAVISPVAT